MCTVSSMPRVRLIKSKDYKRDLNVALMVRPEYKRCYWSDQSSFSFLKICSWCLLMKLPHNKHDFSLSPVIDFSLKCTGLENRFNRSFWNCKPLHFKCSLLHAATWPLKGHERSMYIPGINKTSSKIEIQTTSGTACGKDVSHHGNSRACSRAIRAAVRRGLSLVSFFLAIWEISARRVLNKLKYQSKHYLAPTKTFEIKNWLLHN